MPYSLLWLPEVLRAAGLQVQEVPDWQTRGHGDVRDIRGVICHHTCGPKDGDIKDLHVLIDGREDLPGPLCELGLARSGTYHVVAAGKPWHAGRGNWKGITDGNAQMIGIEAENTGETTGPRADPWPEVQMDAYARGVAAILKHVGAPPSMCCGHKEYALPKGRKDDPSFDMDVFRARVATLMGVPANAKPAATVRYATTTIDGLNLRAAASSQAATLTVLPKGMRVEIHSQVLNGPTSWTSVTLGDKSGWVATRYLDI